MKNWIGRFIIFIGLLHTLVGFIFLGVIGMEILQDGFFNTVNGQPKREAFFWFIFSGIMLLILGQLVHWMERNEVNIPNFLGWNLLALTLLGASIMPLSGIWLMLVPVGGMLRKRFSKSAVLN